MEVWYLHSFAFLVSAKALKEQGLFTAYIVTYYNTRNRTSFPLHGGSYTVVLGFWKSFNFAICRDLNLGTNSISKLKPVLYLVQISFFLVVGHLFGGS